MFIPGHARARAVHQPRVMPSDNLPSLADHLFLCDALRLALAVATTAVDVAERSDAGKVTIAELRGQIRALEEVL